MRGANLIMVLATSAPAKITFHKGPRTWPREPAVYLSAGSNSGAQHIAVKTRDADM